MTEREDSVYKAKLAEQAERYDGNLLTFIILRRECSYVVNDSIARLFKILFAKSLK